MRTLNPLHQSAVRPLKVRPTKMHTMALSVDMRRLLEAEVLDIFTSMSNAGASFPQTLLAIYLSGMACAQEISK